MENGITTGADAAHFSSKGICTRAQAVTFLWRAAGCPQPETRTMPFADVPAGSYFYDAVLWAVETGITTGTDAAHFSPDATCTRGQIVTFLWRWKQSPAAGGGTPLCRCESHRLLCQRCPVGRGDRHHPGHRRDNFRPGRRLHPGTDRHLPLERKGVRGAGFWQFYSKIIKTRCIEVDAPGFVYLDDFL